MAQAQFYRNLARYYDFICSDRKQDVDVLLKLISKHQKSKRGKLLDVACGTGLEDAYLKKSLDVTGIDLHEGVLRIAKSRNPDVRYMRGNMLNFHLKERFDVITCFDAMNYLPTQQQLTRALRNFYDHLTEGGVLIFYIDDTFLKECRKDRTTIVVDHKAKGDLEVILMMINRQRGNRILGQDIFHITQGKRTSVAVEPPNTHGLFEIKKIVQSLTKIGFNTYLYRNDHKTTFSTQPYAGAGGMPVFVCEKSRC